MISDYLNRTLPSTEELQRQSAQNERQIARQERQRVDRLTAQLRALGIDPDL